MSNQVQRVCTVPLRADQQRDELIPVPVPVYLWNDRYYECEQILGYKLPAVSVPFKQRVVPATIVVRTVGEQRIREHCMQMDARAISFELIPDDLCDNGHFAMARTTLSNAEALRVLASINFPRHLINWDKSEWPTW